MNGGVLQTFTAGLSWYRLQLRSRLASPMPIGLQANQPALLVQSTQGPSPQTF